MRVAYLFTSFPKLSERFFLREVVALKRQGLSLSIYSMIGGSADSEAGPVRCFSPIDWLRIIPEGLYWMWVRPAACQTILLHFLQARFGSWTNFGENSLGLAFALRFARQFRNEGYDYVHATWATAPGMAAYALQQLSGQVYTLEAHAYDVFRDGGDALLGPKLQQASAIRSSTDATTHALRRLQRQEFMVPVVCIRRGLAQSIPYRIPVSSGGPFNLLSVGRLIEKKGYADQLEIYAALQQAGVDFRATIVGAGPLLRPLQAQLETLGLRGIVSLKGALSYQQVSQLYAESDGFLFTGQIASSGDRDGFPNVIGEAMAHSVPVFSSDVSGTTEGIVDQETGWIIDPKDPASAAACIQKQLQAHERLISITRAAHAWVEANFRVEPNMQRLQAALWNKGLKD